MNPCRRCCWVFPENKCCVCGFCAVTVVLVILDYLHADPVLAPCPVPASCREQSLDSVGGKLWVKCPVLVEGGCKCFYPWSYSNSAG